MSADILTVAPGATARGIVARIVGGVAPASPTPANGTWGFGARIVGDAAIRNLFGIEAVPAGRNVLIKRLTVRGFFDGPVVQPQPRYQAQRCTSVEVGAEGTIVTGVPYRSSYGAHQAELITIPAVTAAVANNLFEDGAGAALSSVGGFPASAPFIGIDIEDFLLVPGEALFIRATASGSDWENFVNIIWSE